MIKKGSTTNYYKRAIMRRSCWLAERGVRIARTFASCFVTLCRYVSFLEGGDGIASCCGLRSAPFSPRAAGWCVVCISYSIETLN